MAGLAPSLCFSSLITTRAARCSRGRSCSVKAAFSTPQRRQLVASKPASLRAKTVTGAGARRAGVVVLSMSQAQQNASSGWDVHLGVMGDLHLDSREMELFFEARAHLRGALTSTRGKPLPGAHVVQLGDLGAYSSAPGSRACFQLAHSFLDGFQLPFSLITGNHDLEGFEDFSSDAANLQGWREQFGQHHFWARECGSHLLVGLSTVRFRDAEYSSHEVFIDDEQLAWFERTLAENRGKPTVVFTHAPIMGCGLRVLQSVHVKNRCAWLNHSHNPHRFAEIVAVNPQIKLWFSGHFHLSHDYRDSISVLGECAFVQVGVIGATSSRDKRRHSRVLMANKDGYELYTMDHSIGKLRMDLKQDYASSQPPRPIPPLGDNPDPEATTPGNGWLTAADECSLTGPHAQWLFTGVSELSVQNDFLIEYDMRTRAPIGIVHKKLDGRKIRLVDLAGNECDGLKAAAVEVIGADGEVERVERNTEGSFYQIFQTNKYQRWLKEKEAKKAAAAAEQLVGAVSA